MNMLFNSPQHFVLVARDDYRRLEDKIIELQRGKCYNAREEDNNYFSCWIRLGGQRVFVK